MRKEHGHSVEVATLAPSENIEYAFKDLGGEEGAIRRQKGKRRGQQKREEHITEQLREAILQGFPKIPRENLEEILARCRRPGAVGTAQWLYFETSAISKESFERAANLAVRAHVRHKYTEYDEILFKSHALEIFYDESPRKDARAAVSNELDDILRKWK